MLGNGGMLFHAMERKRTYKEVIIRVGSHNRKGGNGGCRQVGRSWRTVEPQREGTGMLYGRQCSKCVPLQLGWG